MVAAGLLNKRITIQRLERVETPFGSENKLWHDVFSAWCHLLVPSISDRRQAVDGEVFVGDVLTFQCRKYVCKYLALEYRIIYRCKPYRILKIDDEGDDLFILAELINT
jgi:head-tail adaptor